MKKSIQTVHKIVAPVENVWEFIKSGEKWEKWLPILSGSEVVGNSRTCDMPTEDGNKDVFEELFIASDAEKTFIYQINKQQSFPADDIVGYIRLTETGDFTTMYWTVEMSIDSEEVFAPLKEQIEGIYASGAAKLEDLATVSA